MSKASKIERMRNVGLATNEYHISKWVSRDPELAQHNNPEFIEKAAKWNFRKFGFGRVSLELYLAYLHNKKNGRLYNIDVKAWYKLINQVFKRDNYTCQYCGKIGGKLECDHIHPLSKGGTNDLENLTTACQKCNRQKKDKSVSEFLEWKGNRI